MTALRLFLGLAAPVFLLSLASAPLLADRAERPIEKGFGAEIKSIEVENLVGRIEVKQSDSGRVSAQVVAEDSAGKSGHDWTQAIDVEFEQRGDRLVVKAVYPLDRYRRYHYPVLGEDEKIEPSWLASWFDFGGTSFDYEGHHVRVVGHAASDTPTV